MDIFGLTPVDAALSALGLNFAQLINQFFTKTPLASLAFTAGALLAIGRLVRTGSSRAVLPIVFLTLAIIILLLPHRPEGTIQSAAEKYGQAFPSSQSLKDQIYNYHEVPVLLSYANQAATALLIGCIHALDAAVPAWASFLPAPFGLQSAALSIREAVQEGIDDPPLRQDLDVFLYQHYLPAMALLLQDAPQSDVSALWPGQARISSYYSTDAKREWSGLETRLGSYFDQKSAFSGNARAALAPLTQSTEGAVEQGLIKSVANHQLDLLAHTHESGFLWQACSWVLNAFPYISGAANCVLAVFFPFLLALLVLTRSVAPLFSYLKYFAWVKSWILSGAFSFYFSLFVARLHPASADPSWAWEAPHYAAAAALAIVLLPGFTFFLINKGGC